MRIRGLVQRALLFRIVLLCCFAAASLHGQTRKEKPCFHVSVEQIDEYASKLPADSRGDAVIEYIDRDGCTLKLFHQKPLILPKDHLQFPQPPPISGAVGWKVWQLNPPRWPKP